jgi:SAM-dependent methyltransferase
LNLDELAQLVRVAFRRKKSEEDYRIFQAYQAQLVSHYLEAHGVRLRHQNLLDLGSGLTGYSQVFAQEGARVISLDLLKPKMIQKEKFAYVCGNAMAVPFVSEFFDLVFCASLIEHVIDPLALLKEVERLLKTGGIAYISFPPYYSFMGGHEFSPFHYLGEKTAIRIVQRRKKMPDWVSNLHNAPDQALSFTDLYQNWGLYIMTIRKFKHILASTNLRCLDMSTRYMSASFVRWPILGELLTWHAQFLLVKSKND